jgi:long-chain acyl-CoA synthetase
MRIKVEGLEHLKNIEEPVIFMPNHISYVDPLALYMALPFKTKQKLAFMAAADVLYGEFTYVAWLAELFFNSVMLNRKEGQNIKVGLDYIGKLLDKNYSVVFFPEGKVSVDGSFQELQKGPGLLAVEMRVPIIPVRIIGSDKVVPPFKIFPRKMFGKVKIIFGKPLYFKMSDSHEDALRTIEVKMEK